MKTETKIRMYGIIMAVSSIVYMGCYVYDNEISKPVNQAFYNGQILAPDYVLNDSMVVINAAFLNESMNDGKFKTDGDIYEILQEGSVNIADYQDYIKVVAAND